MQFAWKDNGVVLFMSTIATPGATTKSRQRQLDKTRIGAATIRRVFSSDLVKELLIPKFIDLYNHFINGVN